MTGTSTQPLTSRTVNDRKIIAPFCPLGWQVAPWRDTSLVMLLTGSAGGGKSRLAGEKAHAYCKKYPGAMALGLRKTRESMVNSTVLVLERRIIGNDPEVKHNQHKSRFEYANGSILAYGGMKDEAQRQQIRSIGQDSGLGFCWMEEANAFVEADFNEVLGRMRAVAAPWRQICLSTNPDAPTHWIYKRLIEGKEANVYTSGAAENTYNPAEYLSTLGKLTGVQKLRLEGGKWVQAEGAVYPAFDPNVHLIPSFKIPDSWRRIRSIDFGYTNPFVCQWWAIDPDGRMYLYREIYRTQTIVEDHAKQISELSIGEHIEQTVADHDAEDRATLNRYHVPTIPAFKLIRPGIQAVESRLEVAGDGKPRLFILEGALVEEDQSLVNQRNRPPTSTLQEFPGYVWPKGQDGKPVKEEPVDLNNHGMDCVRYAVMHLDSSNFNFQIPDSIPYGSV